MAWTDPAKVAAALGPSAAPPVDDPWLVACCDAANAAAFRKRREAGYVDEPDTAGADVVMGTTQWAVALWRSRGAADGFPSFEDLSSFMPTGGTWGEIRRMLGIGRAAVDALPPDEAAAVLERRRRRRLARSWRW